MFRQQFKMTKREENRIREVAALAVLVYLKAWITASLAVEAPFNDFQLMGQLLRYTRKNVCCDQQEAWAAFMVPL